MENSTNQRVKQYWNQGSCGTERTSKEKYSQEYFTEIEEFRYQYEPYIHTFAQFTRWHNKKMLEVGIGAGTDFLQFVRAGAQAHGVDLTEEAIANVEQRLSLYQLSAQEIKVTNAEKLNYPDNYFDLTYSWGVIHHTDNMEQALAEIYRVTKPGGRVKIMIYNAHSLHVLYMYIRHALLKGKIFKSPRWAIYHYQESYATKVYTKTDIKKMLRQFPHYNLRFYYWNQLIRDGAKFASIRKLLHKILPKWTRWYLAFEFEKSPVQA